MMKQHAEDLHGSLNRGDPQSGTKATPPIISPDNKPTTTSTATTERAAIPPLTVDDGNAVDLKICVPAKTEVQQKREDGSWRRQEGLCVGDIIFQDEFSKGPGIDTKKWTHEVKMPWNEDYEFVTYQQSIQNSYTNDSKLFIKPTILNDDYVRTAFRSLENCTGEAFSQDCDRQAVSYSILPPIDSALLTTKHTMNFRYGEVEIRAKLPTGDWIIPELFMKPVNKRIYGRGHSGIIYLALAKGNRYLMYKGRDIGNNRLEMGFEIGDDPPRKTSRHDPKGWGDGFHSYKLIWTPDNLKFQVDDHPPEALCPSGEKLYQALGLHIPKGKRDAWNRGSNIAPFDKEFYLTVGLSVGGLKHFEDGSISSGKRKPWMNDQSNAMEAFWRSRNDWSESWNSYDGKGSELVIDYVKVTAV